MTKLYLTRHGQTLWNFEGRMQGQKNSNLTELGEKQARTLGKRLLDVDIDIIISSSAGRALSTAELIRGDRNIEIIQNENLVEMYVGEWEGMLHTEVSEVSPDEQHNFWNNPHLFQSEGKETFSQVFERASNEIEHILSKYEGKNILVVSHGIILRSLLTYFEKRGIEELWNGPYMRSCCLNLIEVENENRRIVLQGDISHYEPEDIALLEAKISFGLKQRNGAKSNESIL